jgi:hypothetical protein
MASPSGQLFLEASLERTVYDYIGTVRGNVIPRLSVMPSDEGSIAVADTEDSSQARPTRALPNSTHVSVYVKSNCQIITERKTTLEPYTANNVVACRLMHAQVIHTYYKGHCIHTATTPGLVY